MLTTRRNKLFSAFCKRSSKWTLHKFDFTGAVHRIGKRKENKHRPIIARFVCREDRDQVFARKKGIKESTRFKDAYITADYAKAIQDERRKLIKAMFKAKEQGSEAKVIGRYLYIGELKYDVTNIPEDFK